MKVLSLWQPYASLLIHGHKPIETRGWPAPDWIMGETIGIASTKHVRKEQRGLFAGSDLKFRYLQTQLPLRLEELPHGFLLGTAVVRSCMCMTEDDLRRICDRERWFGDWQVGRYAWHVTDLHKFEDPIPVSGGQKLWNYEGAIPDKDAGRGDQAEPA